MGFAPPAKSGSSTGFVVASLWIVKVNDFCVARLRSQLVSYVARIRDDGPFSHEKLVLDEREELLIGSDDLTSRVRNHIGLQAESLILGIVEAKRKHGG